MDTTNTPLTHPDLLTTRGRRETGQRVLDLRAQLVHGDLDRAAQAWLIETALHAVAVASRQTEPRTTERTT